jgi:chromosome segregation ATPase
MTVPGKGGRPRKWRSDTDRQRAYRARQTGLDEPPTLVQALDDGDELAELWAKFRDQAAQLAAANETAKQLRHERDQARRELASEQQRWGWIESRNTELQAERDRLAEELNAAIIEQIDLRDRLARLQRAAVPPPV